MLLQCRLGLTPNRRNVELGSFYAASRLIIFFQHISQMMSYLDLHVPSTYQSKKQGSISINLLNDVRSDVYLIITNT